MILSDRMIKQFIEEGKLSIQPFVEKNLTPNGYDLSISEIYIPSIEMKVTEGVAKIPPMTWFALSTTEYVKFGTEISAQLWIRTSWARKGIIAAFGKIDAGFHGTLTFSAFNASQNTVEFPIGDRFAQMVFELMAESAELEYSKRSGHYQGQRGVTLERKNG